MNQLRHVRGLDLDAARGPAHPRHRRVLGHRPRGRAAVRQPRARACSRPGAAPRRSRSSTASAATSATCAIRARRRPAWPRPSSGWAASTASCTPPARCVRGQDPRSSSDEEIDGILLDNLAVPQRVARAALGALGQRRLARARLEPARAHRRARLLQLLRRQGRHRGARARARGRGGPRRHPRQRRGAGSRADADGLPGARELRRARAGDRRAAPAAPHRPSRRTSPAPVGVPALGRGGAG